MQPYHRLDPNKTYVVVDRYHDDPHYTVAKGRTGVAAALAELLVERSDFGYLYPTVSEAEERHTTVQERVDAALTRKAELETERDALAGLDTTPTALQAVEERLAQSDSSVASLTRDEANARRWVIVEVYRAGLVEDLKAAPVHFDAELPVEVSEAVFGRSKDGEVKTVGHFIISYLFGRGDDAENVEVTPVTVYS